MRPLTPNPHTPRQDPVLRMRPASTGPYERMDQKCNSAASGKVQRQHQGRRDQALHPKVLVKLTKLLVPSFLHLNLYKLRTKAITNALLHPPLMALLIPVACRWSWSSAAAPAELSLHTSPSIDAGFSSIAVASPQTTAFCRSCFLLVTTLTRLNSVLLQRLISVALQPSEDLARDVFGPGERRLKQFSRNPAA